MSPPIPATKLHLPRPRPGAVRRERLDGRLDRTLDARLTVVSAPAGFGKTSAVTAWLATLPVEVRVAWLSLDAGDDDPETFWRGVVAALGTTDGSLGAETLRLLDAGPGAMAAAVTALLNDLAGVTAPTILVLDDYHEVRRPAIHDAVGAFVERLPAAIHLVLTTRADPPLALPRLRVRGELVEVRAADLRFTDTETADLLGGTMGLALTADQVGALERRTEGWVAALQLAGLSLQGRRDPDGFIAGFTGDDRFVVDYLADEVLDRQPADIRSFLLATSVLARLTGPLCDAVTEAAAGAGRVTLERLERANLFVVPLDDRRAWYRYHHLFGDVLEARLLAEQPEMVPVLHRRASAWWEAHDDRPEAIRHALAGGDTERAADLIELAVPEMRRTRREALLWHWFEQLPDALVRARPALALGAVGALLTSGEVAGVLPLLDAVERAVGDAPVGAEPDGGSPGDRRVIAAEAAMYRSALARMAGDLEASMAAAERALALSGGEPLGVGAAEALLGLGSWSRGDLATAQRRYEVAMTALTAAGHVADVLGCTLASADMELERGRVGRAEAILRDGLRLATPTGGPILRGAADMLVGLGEVARERDALEEAAQLLDRAEEMGDAMGLPQHPYRRRVLAAGLRLADGDVDGALTLLEDAERRQDTDMSPDVRPIAARRARIAIAAGRLGEARAWAASRELDADEAPTYLRGYELATYARLLAAAGAADRDGTAIAGARRLAGRLIDEAAAHDRIAALLDARIAAALAAQAAGDPAAAATHLEAAVALAAPEGMVRTFLDEGPALAAVAVAATRRTGASPALRHLAERSVTVAAPARRAAPQPLIEPLSDRELDVLRLLAGELDGPGIAAELVVSLNTVRTHTKNVYGKLGVNNRRAAVRRGVELGLLPPGA
jgi:LuxR family maltose regulon positive regulatory protein